jgi:hypothetical protein
MTFVRNLDGWRADARLYALNDGRHVIVSVAPATVEDPAEALSERADAEGNPIGDDPDRLLGVDSHRAALARI